MEEQSVRDARLAVRGARYNLTIYTTNPYALAHWFVNKYTKMLPPNRYTLLNKGYQWSFLENERALMHYTNYRVNPAISPQKVEETESLRDKDPAFYDVVGIGLPGVPKGGVYAHLLKHSSRLIQPVNTFSLGLDWGFKHDPLTVILIGTQSNTNFSYQNVNVLEELQLTNYSRYSHKDLAYLVVKWIRSLGKLYSTLREGITCYCDKSNLTWLEMLNDAAKQIKLEWCIFVPAPQIEVEQRIGFKQGLLSVGKLNISLDCNVLYTELLLATWDLKSLKPKLMSSCADHMSDAFDYAMSPWYGPFYQKHLLNSYYLGNRQLSGGIGWR